MKLGDVSGRIPTAKQVWEAAVKAVLVPFSPELERKTAWMETMRTVKNWRSD
jgi:hypothetical protein